MNHQGDIQVTAKEAAAQVGVARATVDTWVHRGYLTPIPGSGRPAKFWLSEVFTAEATRNDNMRRDPATLAKARSA